MNPQAPPQYSPVPPWPHAAPHTYVQPAILTIAVRQSGLATAALVLGLCTFVTFGATGIPAVVLGIAALNDIKRRGVPGQGAAITGLVFGGLAALGWLGWWGLVALGSMMGGTS